MKKLLYFSAIFTILLILPLLSGCQKTETYSISYECTEGGFIDGQATQTVTKGENAASVTATPNEGYMFTGWSDGITSPRRNDNNLTKDLTVTAYFKKISLLVTYLADNGGTIEGTCDQNILYGENATSVTAAPNYGYTFTGWSDGITSARRSDNNLTEDLTVTAYFHKHSYVVNYIADNGGTIKGQHQQYIPYCGNTTEVIAVPNKNYKFIGWDDGLNENSRSDENITKSQTFTALFEQIGTIFNFVYNNATENSDIPNVLINFGSENNVQFPVPQRINSTFEGWYSDKDFTTQVTGKDGKLLDDNIIYNYDNQNLYAKFSLIEEVSYKILMVYVTAVKGTFETYYGDFISVDYKMSEVEKQLCEIITEKFAKTLNEMFAGLVRFEADSYFTTEVVGAESFSAGSSSSYGNFDYSLDAYRIPELQDFELLNNYRSVFTTVPLEMDKEGGINPPHKLHSAAGLGGRKYACVYWEVVAGNYIIGDKPIERLLDSTNQYYNSAWDKIMQLYAHEFCHTVEKQIPKRILYDYHETIDFYLRGTYLPGLYPASTELDVIKLFLLNQAKDTDGVKYGIPYDLWGDKIKFNVTFIAGENGSISGNLNQTTSIGGKNEPVTAIPDFGYRFVKWSTGFTDPKLTNIEVYSDRTITAIFEEITQQIAYIYVIDNKWVGGYGENLRYKDFLSTTLHIPEIDGYEFEGWFLDQEFTLPIGDKYGKVTEDDYKIFDKEIGYGIILYGKFSKK